MRRRLSYREAQRCENGETARCRCRCKRARHGLARGNVSLLPANDPHAVALRCLRASGRRADECHGVLRIILVAGGPLCEYHANLNLFPGMSPKRLPVLSPQG